MANGLADVRVAHLFADDTLLLVKSPCVEQARALARVNFEGAKRWFMEKKLLLNEDKLKNSFSL